MYYVVFSESTGYLNVSDVYDSLFEARDQMNLWADVDKGFNENEEEYGYTDDWADYIVAVDNPVKIFEDGNVKHADNERFIEGECGRGYNGPYDRDCKTCYPEN